MRWEKPADNESVLTAVLGRIQVPTEGSSIRDREGQDEAKAAFLVAEAELQLPGRGGGSLGGQSAGSQVRGTGADRHSGKQHLSRQSPWQGA